MPIDKSLKTEPSEFRLFGCDHGCFHLEWKYFAIVHMTAEHLLRLYQQLVGVYDRSCAVEQACEAGCVCLECNDDIQIKLKRTEAVVLMAQVGAFLQMQSHNKLLVLRYVM